jgi:hypothetical protein
LRIDADIPNRIRSREKISLTIANLTSATRVLGNFAASFDRMGAQTRAINRVKLHQFPKKCAES